MAQSDKLGFSQIRGEHDGRGLRMLLNIENKSMGFGVKLGLETNQIGRELLLDMED